ncbi:hypothetical protein [Mycobacterium sp. Marseille-P9652]|uniref:hypothetical protein n=1 Tax=Mycobacterium sp. Marseille-P9652 TaxID=2654950 RepID=UPI0012E97D52|nr:hypothetical protein [Mycobacterium sp. Marseille-P9652]
MRAIVAVAMRSLAGIASTVAAAIAGLAAPAAATPPEFPGLDGFTAVPADGYVTSPHPGDPPRVSFTASPTLVCDFYGGPAPAPHPSGDIKCTGDMPGMNDVLFPGGGRSRPGDCVVGVVSFKGPGYELSRMSYGGCDGNPAALPSGGKPLAAGQKVSYLNVTCAVGADDLVACLDTTSGEHGFVLQRSGSWAF